MWYLSGENLKTELDGKCLNLNGESGNVCLRKQWSAGVLQSPSVSLLQRFCLRQMGNCQNRSDNKFYFDGKSLRDRLWGRCLESWSIAAKFRPVWLREADLNGHSPKGCRPYNLGPACNLFGGSGVENALSSLSSVHRASGHPKLAPSALNWGTVIFHFSLHRNTVPVGPLNVCYRNVVNITESPFRLAGWVFRWLSLGGISWSWPIFLLVLGFSTGSLNLWLAPLCAL